jgi:hypothetical protein
MEDVYGQTKPYTRAPIYIMVMHKESIFNWYSCYTQVKAHSKAKRKRIVFKQFIKAKSKKYLVSVTLSQIFRGGRALFF